MQALTGSAPPVGDCEVLIQRGRWMSTKVDRLSPAARRLQGERSVQLSGAAERLTGSSPPLGDCKMSLRFLSKPSARG